MPELPEVETVRTGLEKSINSKTISKIILNRKKIRFDIPLEILKAEKSKIISIERRSKYLLVNLSNAHTIIIHLGMSGKVLVHKTKLKQYDKHDHFAIIFTDNSEMVFNDARRFGVVDYTKTANLAEHKLLKDLGPEPLTDKFNDKYFIKQFMAKTKPIKIAIMDAKNVVGVGNIYASESLYRAGINPAQACGKVSEEKLSLLVKSIKQVLKEAIKSGGSTLRDYVRSDGDLGYFQHNFKVYGRDKDSCFKCKAEIKKIVQQGRSTYYCPRCQK
jgi:formamidopyrimidine-DNA glycosylase